MDNEQHKGRCSLDGGNNYGDTEQEDRSNDVESATINWTDFLRVCTMTAYEERNFNHVREKTTQTAAYLYVRIQTATC